MQHGCTTDQSVRSLPYNEAINEILFAAKTNTLEFRKKKVRFQEGPWQNVWETRQVTAGPRTLLKI